jgi:SAM-dependent methyltransferase
VARRIDVTTLARQAPGWLRPVLRRVATTPRLNRALRRPRWGNLRRDRPFSRRAGDRGTPIERFYSDRFVAEHGGAVRGHVLEVGSDRCARAHGRDVRRVDVVDIATDNRRATIVADLADAGSLPADTFDCAIAAHVLQFVPDVPAALANLWQSVRPGGCLLVTVPALGRCAPSAEGTESWRFLEPGLRHAVGVACRPTPEAVTVRSYGNLRTAIAALAGIAAGELRAHELDTDSPEYPVVLGLALTKPSDAATASTGAAPAGDSADPERAS